MRALISWALYALPSMSIFQSLPMWRLTERIVRSGLVIAWRLATSPTRTSPVFENATTEGVVRLPSALGMTTGSPASSTETTELAVPRSMTTDLDIACLHEKSELSTNRAYNLTKALSDSRTGRKSLRSRPPEPAKNDDKETLPWPRE